ncbi:MAG: hypothetical protein KAU21_18770 [Gammaproteobacteria bacterium]|nr:hypothetical protein [Gammaproteobacteria bacterium]
MTTNKLLNAISDFFDESKKKQLVKKKYLKQVLHKLKTKCKKQRKKLADEKDKGKRQILQKELNIICAQRKKGLKRLKQMK